MPSSWLALMIGSSRLHWAWFVAGELKAAWDLSHLSEAAIAPLIQTLDFRSLEMGLPLPPDLPPALPPNLPLWIASVVPAQMQCWQRYSASQVLTLDQVPLKQTYPTMGIDRALALWGAGDRYGFPALVIDAGTALTLTGADPGGNLQGGAILPGVQLQMRSLHEYTAALPALSTQAAQKPNFSLPPRWATQTPAAIQSGILYTLLAGLHDFTKAWLYDFPQSTIVLTGGDSQLLAAGLAEQFPALAKQMITDPQIIFWGMKAAIEQLEQSATSS